MMFCPKCGKEIDSGNKYCPSCGAFLEKMKESDDRGIHKVWPDWTVEKQLGSGSYGTVYQAVRRDSDLVTRSAIKVISIPSSPAEMDSLRSEGLGEEGTRTYLKGIVDNFIDEIRLMETLKATPNIVSVEDYKLLEKKEDIGWDIYIRMELLTPFTEYMEKNVLGEKEIIKLGCDICSALEICSRRNIIHRDIKPENIFINDFGYFKLGDFGIARELENVSGSLSQKGTFNYMAPEVAATGSYDERVDIYSLGIVLYRLFNKNRLPFLETQQQVLNPNERRNAVERRLKGEQLPPPSDASAAMADVILRACAYDPDKRFSSASEMKRALENVFNGSCGASPPEQDETVSVASPPDYDDSTVAARKPIGPNISSEIGTFGVPNAKAPVTVKQKRKSLFIIPVILILAVIVSLFLVFIINNTSDAEDEPSEGTTLPVAGEYNDTSEPAPTDSLSKETEAAELKESESIGTDSVNEDIKQPEISYDIGDIVVFGAYEQDSDIANGKEPIEWIVLDEEEGDYLLLSRYALDCRSYDISDTNGNWTISDLRAWLNDVFYNTAFSESEKNGIISYSHTVIDKIFCLSVSEVNLYLPSVSSRCTSATPYAVARGSYQENGLCGWWLRGNGENDDYAARVNMSGNILSGTSSEGGTRRTDYSVRPAIWVDLD